MSAEPGILVPLAGSGILDYFPLAKIRPVQEQALLEVFAAFEAGKKFVILEAPPGTGKSPLAVALARYYRSAYILTATKLLQRQYVDSFTDARELKGRSNFDCVRLTDIGGSCESGGDRFKCPPAECPYRIAKAEAVLSDLTICNYMSYLYSVGTTSFSSAALVPPFDGENERWTRPVLICDEAHGIEGVLLDLVSVTIDPGKIPFEVAPMPDPTNVAGCFAWLELFSQEVSETLDDNGDAQQLPAKTKKVLERLARKALFALEHRDAEEWISEPGEGRGFVLKPLTVRSFAHRLFAHGERVLLMSATILDAAQMAKSLGITDYAYVSVPCPFPVENRPVIVSGLNMTMQRRAFSWPTMVDQIGIILDAHPDEKGLILCPSYEMVEYIRAGLVQRDRLVVARKGRAIEDLQRHLDAKGPTVLISPGFWEGLDLKDDRSRFQIIPAAPRPFWGGQVMARTRIEPNWYRLQTFAQLIQGLGRSVRSETDSAVSYVLDVELRKEAERSDTILPEWFREALIYA